MIDYSFSPYQPIETNAFWQLSEGAQLEVSLLVASGLLAVRFLGIRGARQSTISCLPNNAIKYICKQGD